MAKENQYELTVTFNVFEEDGQVFYLAEYEEKPKWRVKSKTVRLAHGQVETIEDAVTECMDALRMNFPSHENED